MGIAKEIGVYPYFFKLLLRDPKLAIAALFGPTVSYLYRIVGKNSDPNARKNVLNTWNNSMSGLNYLKKMWGPTFSITHKTSFISYDYDTFQNNLQYISYIENWETAGY